jgi:HEAT repeat protein
MAVKSRMPAQRDEGARSREAFEYGRAMHLAEELKHACALNGPEARVLSRKAANMLIDEVWDKGPAARIFMKLLEDGSRQVRAEATWALIRMGRQRPEMILELLREGLASGSPLQSRHSAIAIGKLGADAVPAIPDLGIALAQSGDKETVREAGNALVEIARSAPRQVRFELQFLREQAQERLSVTPKSAGKEHYSGLIAETDYLLERIRGS